MAKKNTSKKSASKKDNVAEDVTLGAKLRLMDLAVSVGKKEFTEHYKKMCSLVFGD